MSLLRIVLISFVVCFGAFYLSNVQAKQVPFSDKAVVTYDLRAEKLADFLHRFAADQGLGMVLSESIDNDKRTLNGIRKGKPSRVFQSILSSNNLMAYFDGSRVHVVPLSEMERQYLHLSHREKQELRNTFKHMALFDEQNYVKFIQDSSFIEVVGVPYFVAQISQIYESLRAGGDQRLVFKYFPLKYAWAINRTIMVGNQEVEVSGVATILRDAIGSVAPQKTNAVSSDRSDRSWYYGPATRVSPREKLKVYTEKLNQGNLISPNRNSDAYIVADPQHNAIIVRDFADRIPLYEDLIRQLDKPSQLVEIEATIIDINTDKLMEAGVDWRYGKQDHEALFSNSEIKENFVNVIAGDDISLLDQSAGFQLGAIIGNKNRFLARINLLQTQGVLEVTSKPKVATLNDLEAVIESSRSLYVPVEGAYDVNLFRVFSGTILRVTPHVINQEPLKQILMVISVEDGTIELSGENNTPLTTKHSVSTQTMVTEGRSLLLGGLVRSEATTEVTKVPVLGDIPLLGKLFSSSTDINRKTERLFLITPKVISPDGQTVDKVAVTEPHNNG